MSFLFKGEGCGEVLLNEFTKRYVLLAQDWSDRNGAKRYTAMTVEKWNQNINEILSSDHSLYEYLDCKSQSPEKNLKLFFDLDMKTSEERQNNFDSNQTLVECYLKFVSDQILLTYSVHVSLADWIILDSSREEKISFHIILQNGICFSSMVVMKSFIRLLVGLFDKQSKEFQQMMSYPDGETRKQMIDLSVYKEKNQLLRLIGQTKKGHSHVLKCYNPSIEAKDTFIQLHGGADGRIIIDHMLDEFIEKERKTLTKSVAANTRNYLKTSTEYQREGPTLQEKENVTYESMKLMPLYLQYLYLIPNESQSREVFLQIGYAIRGCEGKEEDFRRWAQLSKTKYTMGRTVAQFNSFHIGKLGIEYLKARALNAHEDYFDRNLVRLQAYVNPNFGTIPVITENTRYISDDVLAMTEDMILLDSPLGTGKTSIMRKMTRDYTRILIIAPRITFAHFISKEFDTVLYLDEGVDLASDKLTISMESLHRVKDQCYDVVILDEVEANLSIFKSPTLRDRQNETFNTLVSIIGSAKKIILAGAFITNKTILFMTHFTQKTKVCIRNTNIPREKTAIRLDDAQFTGRLYKSIEDQEKNYVCYSSYTAMKDDVSILSESESDHVKAVMGNTVLISKDSSGATISALKNMEKCLGPASMVMATPALTVGNSYCPEKPDFHNVFIRGYPTCIVADTFQSHFRVRETINNRLFYSLPSRKILNIKSHLAKLSFDMLDKYDESIARQDTLVGDTMREAFLTLALKDDSALKDIRNVIAIFHSNEKAPIVLQKIMMSIFEEETLSAAYYEKMFHTFLKKLNYKIEDEEIILTSDQKNEMEQMEKNKKDSRVNYSDITEIDDEEKALLEKKVKHVKASTAEKQQVTKRYFQMLLGAEMLTDPEVCDFYFKQYESSHQKEQLENGQYELKVNLIESVLGTGTTRTEQLRCNKALILQELTSLLGLESSYDTKEISRGDVEKTIPFFNDRTGDIRTLFPTTLRQAEYKFETTVTHIKSIFKSWNNCAFKSIIDKHKKVTAYHFTCINAFVRDGITIPPFKKSTDHVIIEKSNEVQRMQYMNDIAMEVDEIRANREENKKRKHEDAEESIIRKQDAEIKRLEQENYLLKKRQMDITLENLTRKKAHVWMFKNQK
jgi:hypothetical protein